MGKCVSISEVKGEVSLKWRIAVVLAAGPNALTLIPHAAPSTASPRVNPKMPLLAAP